MKNANAILQGSSSASSHQPETGVSFVQALFHTKGIKQLGLVHVKLDLASVYQSGFYFRVKKKHTHTRQTLLWRRQCCKTIFVCFFLVSALG